MNALAKNLRYFLDLGMSTREASLMVMAYRSFGVEDENPTRALAKALAEPFSLSDKESKRAAVAAGAVAPAAQPGAAAVVSVDTLDLKDCPPALSEVKLDTHAQDAKLDDVQLQPMDALLAQADAEEKQRLEVLSVVAELETLSCSTVALHWLLSKLLSLNSVNCLPKDLLQLIAVYTLAPSDFADMHEPFAAQFYELFLQLKVALSSGLSAELRVESSLTDVYGSTPVAKTSISAAALCTAARTEPKADDNTIATTVLHFLEQPTCACCKRSIEVRKHLAVDTEQHKLVLNAVQSLVEHDAQWTPDFQRADVRFVTLREERRHYVPAISIVRCPSLWRGLLCVLPCVALPILFARAKCTQPDFVIEFRLDPSKLFAPSDSQQQQQEQQQPRDTSSAESKQREPLLQHTPSTLLKAAVDKGMKKLNVVGY